VGGGGRGGGLENCSTNIRKSFIGRGIEMNFDLIN